MDVTMEERGPPVRMEGEAAATAGFASHIGGQSKVSAQASVLFGTGHVRYMYTNNGVVCENSNHLYDQSMVQLLLTQNREAGTS